MVVFGCGHALVKHGQHCSSSPVSSPVHRHRGELSHSDMFRNVTDAANINITKCHVPTFIIYFAVYDQTSANQVSHSIIKISQRGINTFRPI
jgi:hypothetical protein